MKAVRALRKFISTAVFTESPELNNTAKSPLRQKAEKQISQAERFLASAKKTTKAFPQWVTVTSHPSRAGSRGTGWPRWSPCQSRVKRRRPPRQPGRRRSYEGCLPRLPSQPAEEPLVLGTQKGVCVVRAHPRTVTIALSCQATNYIVHHIQPCCEGAYSDVKSSSCLHVQEILLYTPGHPLAPAGYR